VSDVFYFGCIGGTGHYWFRPGRDDRELYPKDERAKLFQYIDGNFAPKMTSAEGRAKLSHVVDWTVLAWWDYSVDKRPGSNSALVVKGKHDFDEMLDLLRAHFPEVADRQLMQLQLVERE
jgi:hypothetical protein